MDIADLLLVTWPWSPAHARVTQEGYLQHHFEAIKLLYSTSWEWTCLQSCKLYIRWCQRMEWLLLWGSHREHNIYVSEVSSAATVHLKRINKTQQWSTAFFHVCKSSVGGLSSPIKAETKQTKDLTRKAQTAAEISTVMVELDHFSKTCSFHSQKKNRMSWTG